MPDDGTWRPRPPVMPIADLLQRYIRERDRAAGVLTPKGLIFHLERHFGRLDVRTLDRFHYAEYLAEHRGKRADATLAKELARLNAAINYARRNWRECADLASPPEVEASPSPPRKVFWTPEQVQRLVATASAGSDFELFLAVAIAAYTGARFEAIHDLTWDRINMAAFPNRIDFRVPGKPVTSKRNHDSYPVGRNLLMILHIARKRATTPNLFMLRPDQLRAGLAALVDVCDLPEGSFHTFRHSWATNALAAGMTIHGVAQALAITPAMVVQIYGKADASQERRAMNLYA